MIVRDLNRQFFRFASRLLKLLEGHIDILWENLWFGIFFLASHELKYQNYNGLMGS